AAVGTEEVDEGAAANPADGGVGQREHTGGLADHDLRVGGHARPQPLVEAVEDQGRVVVGDVRYHAGGGGDGEHVGGQGEAGHGVERHARLLAGLEPGGVRLGEGRDDLEPGDIAQDHERGRARAPAGAAGAA